MPTPIRPWARAAACLPLALAALLHLQADARGQSPAQAAADDPQAAVPPTRYQSALDYRAPPAPDTSPATAWVAANGSVAATDSMALTMKSMSGHSMSGHAMHEMKDTKPAPAPAPAPTPTPTPMPMQHGEHHHHPEGK